METFYRMKLWTGALFAAGCAFLACAALSYSISHKSMAICIVYAGLAAYFLRNDPDAFGRCSALIKSLEGFLLFSIISALGAVLTYAAMAYSSGFTDSFLDRCDRLLGYDWMAARGYLDRHSWLNVIFRAAYSSCFIMPFVVIGTLHFYSLSCHMYRFLSAYAIALLITVATFFFFPARAAFAFYLPAGAPLPSNAENYGAVINEIRNGSLTEIDLANLGGIVTFPSFHAAMAILFTWAVWPVRKVRLPVASVNALMWAASVPIGGHYVVDVLGGSLIAVVAISGIRNVERRSARLSKRPEMRQANPPPVDVFS